MVEAMARAGRVEEAQLLFEKMISYANHLGLFSEEIGGKGELLGNFPQALTHLGLISAAHNLDLLLDGGLGGAERPRRLEKRGTRRWKNGGPRRWKNGGPRRWKNGDRQRNSGGGLRCL